MAGSFVAGRFSELVCSLLDEMACETSTFHQKRVDQEALADQFFDQMETLLFDVLDGTCKSPAVVRTEDVVELLAYVRDPAIA